MKNLPDNGQVQPEYARYEQLKRALSDQLTPAQYTVAVQNIARVCGV